MKKKVVIVIVIMVVFLIGLGVCFFIDSIKKDQQKAKETMKEISLKFETFNNQVDTFNNKREELAELMRSDDIYYANFYTNSKKIETVLSNYNKITSEIVLQNDYLKEKCVNYYADTDINGMCEIFNNSFDNIKKVFTNDINSYNKTVQKYNEWTKSNSKFKTINEYVIKDL